MRALKTFEGVYLYREPVDMRLWLDGLSALVRNGMKLPLDGRFLFVFVGKRKDRLKILYWDRTGYALWKANGLEPHAYLARVFAALPNAATADDVGALLPYAAQA